MHLITHTPAMKTLYLLSTDNYIAREATKRHRTNLVLFIQLALAGYDKPFLTTLLSPNRKISTWCIGYLKTNYEHFMRVLEPAEKPAKIESPVQTARVPCESATKQMIVLATSWQVYRRERQIVAERQNKGRKHYNFTIKNFLTINYDIAVLLNNQIIGFIACSRSWKFN